MNNNNARKTPPNEILAFISAANRLPNNYKKELWVKFLVKEFELACTASTIIDKNSNLHK